MIAPPLVALLIGLAGPSAEVTAEALDVYDAPGGAAIRTGRVRKGDRVVVRGEEGDWLAIDPPLGSFSWVEADAIREGDDRRAAVVSRTRARPGSPVARMPGPPGVELEEGEAVRLLPRRPLTLRQGGKDRTWRAIDPPRGEVRYVRADGVDRGGAPPEAGTSPRTRLAAMATVAPGADPPAAPPEVARELSRIEARHREALRDPIERWRLGPIRDAYRDLLARQSDPAARAAVQARLDQAARQERLAGDAREFEALVDRGRRRDADLAAFRDRLAGPATAAERAAYDLRGLLQPSSKMVSGDRVYALIGDDGETSAYLALPPALDPRRMVGHRVGVRGSAHFDEDLNARLFDVRDLELLDD